MARTTEFIQLSIEDRRSLKTLFRSGKGANRQQTRARILDLLDRKVPPPKIAETLSCAVGTVYNVKRRYVEEGLDAASLAAVLTAGAASLRQTAVGSVVHRRRG